MKTIIISDESYKGIVAASEKLKKSKDKGKIERLAYLWVRWNKREITDKDVVGELEKILKKEISLAWIKTNAYHKEQKRSSK